MNTLTTTARRRRHASYETAMAGRGGRDLTEIRASYARWCMAIRRLRVARHVLDLRAGRSAARSRPVLACRFDVGVGRS